MSFIADIYQQQHSTLYVRTCSGTQPTSAQKNKLSGTYSSTGTTATNRQRRAHNANQMRRGTIKPSHVGLLAAVLIVNHNGKKRYIERALPFLLSSQLECSYVATCFVDARSACCSIVGWVFFVFLLLFEQTSKHNPSFGWATATTATTTMPLYYTSAK